MIGFQNLLGMFVFVSQKGLRTDFFSSSLFFFKGMFSLPKHNVYASLHIMV